MLADLFTEFERQSLMRILEVPIDAFAWKYAVTALEADRNKVLLMVEYVVGGLFVFARGLCVGLSVGHC